MRPRTLRPRRSAQGGRGGVAGQALGVVPDHDEQDRRDVNADGLGRPQGEVGLGVHVEVAPELVEVAAQRPRSLRRS